MLTRREFLMKGLGSAVLIPGLIAGGSPLSGAFALAGDPAPSHTPPTETSFACLTTSGKPYDIGLSVGRTFAGEIGMGLERRQKWLIRLRDYAEGPGKKNYETMLGASKEHASQVIEELKGWAWGSGVGFDDLFTVNCNPELDAFMERDTAVPPGGCSTVVVCDEKRLLVVHNEDHNFNYADLMFVMKAAPESGNDFLCLSYPDFMEGNAPAVNRHGIVLTTNYIGSREVKAGIPRYFIHRMVMESKTIDEALNAAQNPLRAFASHHIVASLKEKKAFSIELTPSHAQIREIKGLYIHTNHLILDKMKDLPQFDKYVKLSSIPRYKYLSKTLGAVKDPGDITPELVVKAMSSHEGRPFSVCRHHEGEAEGATVACAVFSSEHHGGDKPYGMKLYKNNPCMGRATDYKLKAQKS
ncbi:MAG: C45 family peptidase [Candidatus Eremiobacteraeota bacterium]|nr:C45 family peptidase [Candidatus Eremiobacteraeota bacterium]